VLAGFNLIPAFPLDGGRMLRSALWKWKGDLVPATRIASSIGSGFAILLMVLAVLQLFAGNFVGAMWWFLIGAFLRMLAQASYAHVVMSSTLTGEPISNFMNTRPDVVPARISIDEFVQQHVYRRHHGMYPVVQEPDRLAVCVTIEQIRTVPKEEWTRHAVQEIATPCTPENTVGPDMDAAEAVKAMSRNKSTRLMVVERDRLLGIVTLKDLLGFLSAKLKLEGQQPKAA
jgi:CBS domain-containing protein